MNTHAVILQAILTAEPSANDPPFHVADLNVTSDGREVTITGRDADGEVSVTITAWQDDGATQALAEFADGVYAFVSVDGDEVIADSNDPTTAGQRFIALETSLESITDTDVMKCAAGVITMVGGCVFGGPWGCIGGTGLAGISCGPIIAEALR